MKEQSREIIRVTLLGHLASMNSSLATASWKIELKECAIRDARSAGARTRAVNELEELLESKAAWGVERDALAEAIREFDQLTATSSTTEEHHES